MNISLSLSVKEAIDEIKGVYEKQIPYAASRAVSKTAYQIQTDTLNRLLPSKFILRNEWWRPGRKTGINYFRADKKQWPDIRAVVNTLAPFMELQEQGGDKPKKYGEPYIAVPTYASQPDKNQLIPRSQTFYQLRRVFKRRKNQTLRINGDHWLTLRNGVPTLYIRLTENRTPISARFVGYDKVTVKPRFGFRANGERIVNENIDANFAEAFENAKATAK